MNELEKGKLIGRCEAFLNERDYRVEEITDFSRVEEIAAMSQKTYLTPLVSPRTNDLTKGNCICLGS